MFVTPPRSVVAAVVLGLSAASCSTAPADAPQPLEPGAFVVPGDRVWTSTGRSLRRGQKLLIEEVEPARQVLVEDDASQSVGARGTYLFDVEEGAYPLEPDRLHDDRRFPGYCLIGRVGEEGPPFFVGSHFKGLADASGTLWLGVNDPTPQANRGAFSCWIAEDYPEPPEPEPTPTEADTLAESNAAPAAPVPPVIKQSAPPATPADANVVIFYIDGLRPDVVTEMAEWGHMPNFRRLFIDNGTWVRNSFTVQPSLTLISYASMVTGTYANRHGVKSQAYYDRDIDVYVNGLSEHFFTRFAAEVEARGVKAIYDYFPDSFAAGALPFQPLRPDILQMNLSEWLHRAVSTAGKASDIRWEMDPVQRRFAVDMASTPQVRVMLVWLPATDVASEHTPHGQFGGARQVVARMDGEIGQIVDRLKNRNRFENTYFILVSDHGHAGGHDVVNRRFDVKREVFHAYLRMNVVSLWQRFDFPGAPDGRLGAVTDCDGAVGIVLPVGHADSGDLSAPNDYAALSEYGLSDGRRVNAVELFAEFSAAGRWPHADLGNRPVDFAVARVDADSVLLYKTMERQALRYPAYILVHDEESVWDGHQMKDNLFGVFDGEVVHWIDMGFDAAIPGRDVLPVQNGIERVKNGYAQLPDVAPVRIVGGLFTAFALEKSTVLGGARMSGAPADPVSYFVFTRAVYLTDWAQETVGEANTGLGHLVPWEGPFFPGFVTTPVNAAVDWSQSGAVTGYMYVFRQINIGLDNVIYAWEWVWGAAVSLFVDEGEPVDQAPSQSAPAGP